MTDEQKQKLSYQMSFAKDSIARYRDIMATVEEMMAIISSAKPDLDTMSFSFSPYNVIVSVKNLAGLKAARKFLRTIYPEYKDTLKYISPLWGDMGYARYTCTTGNETIDKNSILHIDLEAPIEGFPVKLKDGCGFKKVSQTSSSESWSYVCEKKE